jgi:hypothetical protein
MTRPTRAGPRTAAVRGPNRNGAVEQGYDLSREAQPDKVSLRLILGALCRRGDLVIRVHETPPKPSAELVAEGSRRGSLVIPEESGTWGKGYSVVRSIDIQVEMTAELQSSA